MGAFIAGLKRNKTWIFLGQHRQRNEGHGGMLLIRITRTGGTYTGKLGVLDCDAHTIIDRKGSATEYTD